MPRPIINTSTVPGANLSVGSARSSSLRASLTPAELDRRLRSKRTRTYVEAMTRLDAGTHHSSRASLEALLDAIRQEFPELQASDLLQGIVARCHLGAPYEVHTLDCVGDIVQHYKNHEPLPPNLERARALALHPSYAFIEVHSSWLCAVRADGDVAVISG